MFEHELFDNYSFSNIPVGKEIYVVDGAYIKEYEESMLALFQGAKYKHVGAVRHVVVQALRTNSIELSWYNFIDRYHEVSIILPRDQFICCVGSRSCDEKPRIFVKTEWLKNIDTRTYSVFALIDAAYVKRAIEDGVIVKARLLKLRDKIDSLAGNNLDISFISFGDSLLLKSNWSVTFIDDYAVCDYKPELFIRLADEIAEIYKEVLGLETYAVIAQGSNEYYDEPLLHISYTNNHISLNSLGIPFAKIMEIERQARKAISTNVHGPMELYMDEHYFRSLRFKREFDVNAEPSNTYRSKMMETPSRYYYSLRSRIKKSLKI